MTTGVSLARIELISSEPMPGMRKICSVTMAPPKMAGICRATSVTTARSKGLAERVVILKHVVRNALIPVVTLVALQMPIVFSGAIVTEQIFRIPGIGSLLIASILANDTPVVMAVTFVFACLVVLFNLIADVLYGWLDPRIAFR